MITVGVIRNGKTYLSHHLRKNDYWSEGEKEVQGEWIGLGAKALGLEGNVTERPFELLRRNLHPGTEEPLTARSRKERVAFFDIQLSAPKDVSVLAMVGDDERVRTAFVDAVHAALDEMERFAAVRERRGRSAGSEEFRQTRNFVGALFFHDTSRDLDPQLHAHAVLANATWDPQREEWLALQPAEMLRASAYVRQVLYRELASRLSTLGYEPYGMGVSGFSIRGAEHLRERFSKRARQVQQLADEFAAAKGRRPTKREVEVLVRESRSDKLSEASTPEVRERQRAQLDPDELRNLQGLIQRATASPPRQQISHGLTRTVLDAGLRHVFERRSVARDGDVLGAALELHPDFFRWRELRELLEAHPEAIREHGELTLRAIKREEDSAVLRFRHGRNTRFSLASDPQLPASLTPGQVAAAQSLLTNRDFASVLIGDAGTGKTTLLKAIEAAHLDGGGKRFVALAPTTRARDALAESGFDAADTVQRFLVSEQLQADAAARVLLVDEAGLLSTQQLDQLARIAEEIRSRLLLVGDTKQHYSVQRGDALRNVIKHSGIPVTRLSEVLRQRDESDRRFSGLLAAGRVHAAMEYASRRRMIDEAGDDTALFERAAAQYAHNLSEGIDTLVVIPFWEEIERFNEHARPALRNVGIIHGPEVTREAVKPLVWTEEQKVHWNQYRPGDRLLFVRQTRSFRRGTSAEVVEIFPNGLRVRGPDGDLRKIGAKQRTAYDVGRVQHLPIAAGDRLLIRGRDDSVDFENGDFKEVASVDPERDMVRFADGSELPRDFRAWTYGHALTSYRSQGSTAEESLLVLGEVAERSLARRQFYVGNTRYRGRHRIYVSHRDAVLNRLAIADNGRELATEFVTRQSINYSNTIARRILRHLHPNVQAAWHGLVEQWERTRRAVTQRMEI